MRITAFFSLILLCYVSAFAANITPPAYYGKTLYMLEVGSFPNENNALQLKFKLSSQFKQKVSIEYLDSKKRFVVIIGPLNELQEAKEIERQLISEHPPDPAADDQEPSPTEPSTSELVSGKKLWNLRNADIRAVIDEVSRVTGINFVINPRVQGKISIVSTTPMSDKEIYQVFLSVLQVSGYAAIPSGAITKIIPNIDAKTVTTDLNHDLRYPPRGDEMLVQVVPVHFVPAEQLVPALRPLMPQWSNISAYAPSNMLILSGRANNIKKLAEIIKQVDSPNASGVDIVPLHHALAMDIAATLKEIIKTPNAGGARSQMTLAADDRSNTMVVSGSHTRSYTLTFANSKARPSQPQWFK